MSRNSVKPAGNETLLQKGIGVRRSGPAQAARPLADTLCTPHTCHPSHYNAAAEAVIPGFDIVGPF